LGTSGAKGILRTVYSDNAKTFQAGNLELTEIWHIKSCCMAHQFLDVTAIVCIFVGLEV